jgi:hypothetical protein
VARQTSFGVEGALSAAAMGGAVELVEVPSSIKEDSILVKE